MADSTIDPGDTFLTERQVTVLTARYDGETQQSIADKLGTTAANVSAIERAARRNLEKAARTLDLDAVLRATVRVHVEADADVRDVVERLYAVGDTADIHVPYSEPELFALLSEHVGHAIEGRRLTAPVDVGVTPDGNLEFFVE